MSILHLHKNRTPPQSGRVCSIKLGFSVDSSTKITKCRFLLGGSPVGGGRQELIVGNDRTEDCIGERYDTVYSLESDASNTATPNVTESREHYLSKTAERSGRALGAISARSAMHKTAV